MSNSATPSTAARQASLSITNSRNLPKPMSVESVMPSNHLLLASSIQFTSVQSLSHVQLCDPMYRSMPGLPIHYQLPEFTQTHVHQVSDAIQASSSCRPLLLLPSIFSSIRVFSNKSVLCIRWPKYWSFSFNISPSSEHPGLSPLGWTGWISLQSKGLSRVFSNTTV